MDDCEEALKNCENNGNTDCGTCITTETALVPFGQVSTAGGGPTAGGGQTELVPFGQVPTAGGGPTAGGPTELVPSAGGGPTAGQLQLVPFGQVTTAGGGPTAGQLQLVPGVQVPTAGGLVPVVFLNGQMVIRRTPPPASRRQRTDRINDPRDSRVLTLLEESRRRQEIRRQQIRQDIKNNLECARRNRMDDEEEE